MLSTEGVRQIVILGSLVSIVSREWSSDETSALPAPPSSEPERTSPSGLSQRSS